MAVLGLSGQIHVSWTASPDGDVIGYEVFRKLQSDPDTAYAKIHTGLVVGTSFCDSPLTNGVSFCYRVRAVDNTLQESH